MKLEHYNCVLAFFIAFLLLTINGLPVPSLSILSTSVEGSNKLPVE
ncbi:9880_t:CDS:1, partial [Ambispora leptoticha]